MNHRRQYHILQDNDDDGKQYEEATDSYSVDSNKVTKKSVTPPYDHSSRTTTAATSPIIRRIIHHKHRQQYEVPKQPPELPKEKVQLQEQPLHEPTQQQQRGRRQSKRCGLLVVPGDRPVFLRMGRFAYIVMVIVVVAVINMIVLVPWVPLLLLMPPLHTQPPVRLHHAPGSSTSGRIADVNNKISPLWHLRWFLFQRFVKNQSAAVATDVGTTYISSLMPSALISPQQQEQEPSSTHPGATRNKSFMSWVDDVMLSNLQASITHNATRLTPTAHTNHSPRHNPIWQKEYRYLPNKKHNNKLYYIGQFGLGHRMSKLSSVYHLAKYSFVNKNDQNDDIDDDIMISILEVHWGNCKVSGGIDIMSYLFGINEFILSNHPTSSNMLNGLSDHLNHTATVAISKSLSSLSTVAGSTRIDVINSTGANSKVILVRNDVEGYYAGQNYKNAKRPVPISYLCPPASVVVNTSYESLFTDTTSSQHTNGDIHSISMMRFNRFHYNHPWVSKLLSDYEFFHFLLEQFESKFTQIQRFQQQVHWPQQRLATSSNDVWQDQYDHTQQQQQNELVIGVHIRAGNGEKDHFEQARRGSTMGFNNTSTETFVSNLCRLIKVWVQTQYPSDDPSVLLFLATDTAKVIPMVEEACSNNVQDIGSSTTDRKVPPIRVVVYSQARVPDQQGVSYAAWTSEKQCYQGWVDSMIDMTLLSKVDVLIAAQRSTFTQIVPRSQLLDDALLHTIHEQRKQHQQQNSSYANKKGTKRAPNKKKFFCEVSVGAACMTCHSNSWSWLYRDVLYNSTHTKTKYNCGTSTSTDHSNDNQHVLESGITLCGDRRSIPKSVVHKLMVHLPDWEPSPLVASAKTYLRQGQQQRQQHLEPTSGRTKKYSYSSKHNTMAGWHVLGSRINAKYRRSAQDSVFREEWTIGELET